MTPTPTPDRIGARVVKRLRDLADIEADATLTTPDDRRAIARVRRLAAETDLQARGYRVPD